jgi:2-hydroxy-3-keto-5-methylthiopentenyl-1-phosphate phosphatase
VRNVLISDFDGTITQKDFYVLVAERYMPEPRTDYLQLYRNGQMTHFDAMAAYFAHTPTDAGAIESLLRDTDPDPLFSDALLLLREASWDLVIVSAGSSWYIHRILPSEAANVTVHSNPGRLEPGSGLVLERARDAPFYSEQVGVDKAAVVRDALHRCEKVAFAGDGPPDLEAALLVHPHLRFARGYLADELARRGESYREFKRWSEIAHALAAARP